MKTIRAGRRGAMNTGIKRRIYPTSDQEDYLSKCFGHCRWYWNYLVDCGINGIKSKGYSELKKSGYEWLGEVPSIALSNTRMNYQRAWGNARRKSNLPQFHDKRNRQSFTLSCQGQRWLDGNKLYIPKLKKPLRICKNVETIGELKFVTISKTKSDKYYASFSFYCNDCLVPEPTNKKIGIDIGIETFCTTSNGEKIRMPSLCKKEEKVVLEQKRLSRKVFGSNNWKKQKKRLAIASERVASVKLDFQHKLSNRITNENQVIVIEDLTVKNMLKNHKLARSIARQGWRQFADMLKYKSERKGRTLIKIDRFYPSSQICSGCGSRGIKKPLNIRKWKCPDCGASHDRDINAAINILTAGTAGLAC